MQTFLPSLEKLQQFEDPPVNCPEYLSRQLEKLIRVLAKLIQSFHSADLGPRLRILECATDQQAIATPRNGMRAN